MSEVPSLKRDGTMEVTAQAGKEFLESHGMAITDDNVKTRGQKEKLEEISAPTQDQTDGKAEGEEVKGEEEEEEEEEVCPPPPKVARDGTMVVTAREGEVLLGGKELKKTRAKTADKKAKTADKKAKTADKKAKDADKKAKDAEKVLKSPRVKRTTTIAQTAQAGSLILGGGERGRTRSQTRKISESGEEEKKVPVKRTGTMEQTVKDAEEFLGSDAKKAKVDNGSDKIPEAEEPPTSEETEAEA